MRSRANTLQNEVPETAQPVNATQQPSTAATEVDVAHPPEQNSTTTPSTTISSTNNNTNSNSNIQSKKEIACKFFAKGSCKHAHKGESCQYKHPDICQKFSQHGTRQPRGCNLGKSCSKFHPRMCLNSLRAGKCLEQQCRFRHIKGTVRQENRYQSSQAQAKPNQSVRNQPRQAQANANQPVINKSSQAQAKPNQPDRNQPSQAQTNANEPNTGNFLDAFRIMKAELIQGMKDELMMEMDNRIKAHLMQVTTAQHQMQPSPQQPFFYMQPQNYQTMVPIQNPQQMPVMPQQTPTQPMHNNSQQQQHQTQEQQAGISGLPMVQIQNPQQMQVMPQQTPTQHMHSDNQHQHQHQTQEQQAGIPDQLLHPVDQNTQHHQMNNPILNQAVHVINQL